MTSGHHGGQSDRKIPLGHIDDELFPLPVWDFPRFSEDAIQTIDGILQFSEELDVALFEREALSVDLQDAIIHDLFPVFSPLDGVK